MRFDTNWIWVAAFAIYVILLAFGVAPPLGPAQGM